MGIPFAAGRQRRRGRDRTGLQAFSSASFAGGPCAVAVGSWLFPAVGL